ncbi:MAG: class I SAM-dependent methyltransferase [Thiohalomonadales bacterium]
MKKLVKKIPGVLNLYNKIRSNRLKNQDAKAVFTSIYEKNYWKDSTSISGSGSNDTQTEKIVAELPKLLATHSITSILDIPCGDFYWFKKINLDNINYVGADIVEDIINNNKQYASKNISFQTMNLLEDTLPKVDLIIIRDCLVHFSYSDIKRAIKQVVDSGSTYLLTTSFINLQDNTDIETGMWRAINLQKAPLNFSEPIDMIQENCDEVEGKYYDKSLALWSINAISY